MSTKADICFKCGHKMTTRRENVPFLGLPDTTLLGVNVSRCPNCGEHEVEIPMLEELHQGLALQVVEKTGRLSGAEIKFLRTVLDYSSAEFARLVGASPITVSRWEHEVQPIGHHADALIRALVVLRVVAKFSRAKIEQIARAVAAPPSRVHKAKRRAGASRFAMKLAANKWKPTELRAA
jgi:putative zinc finger/helix-turn-helix YgiT family protein